MSIHNDFVLPIPELLIYQLADRVADKVIARLRPLLEKPAVIPAKPVKPSLNQICLCQPSSGYVIWPSE
jgi:hypothetical protein